jgi:hypothetical protein
MTDEQILDFAAKHFGDRQDAIWSEYPSYKGRPPWVGYRGDKETFCKFIRAIREAQ